MKIVALSFLGTLAFAENEGVKSSQLSWPDFIKSCNTPLGLQNYNIPDAQMTSSSRHKSTINSFIRTGDYWHPHLARLDNTGMLNAWMPHFDEVIEENWLQIDLGKEKIINGIVTQGASRYMKDVFVKSFKMEISDDGDKWTTIQLNQPKTRMKSRRHSYHDSSIRTEDPNDLIFYANIDDTSKAVNYMPRFTTARFIRIRPMECYRKCALRMELYGCDYVTSDSARYPDGENIVFETNRVSYNMVNGGGNPK